jgi:hypothetical protein
MIAEVRGAVELGVASQRLESSGQQPTKAVDGGFVVTGGLDLNQLPDGFGDLWFALFEIAEMGGGIGAGGG